MALYSYQAYSKEGKKISGTIDAPTLQSAKDQLAKQGIYIIGITQASQEAALPFYKRLFTKKIKPKEKILFTKQLAVLLKSGVPLLQALELLTEQFEGQVRSMIVAIKDDVKEGTSFADALKKYPKVFENIYVQLVRAGEASGKLEVILDRLTTYLERQAAIKRKIKAATSYPLMQLGVAVLVVIVLMVFVVPQMTDIFESQEQGLPMATRILIAISSFLTTYYIFIIIFLIVAIIAFRAWRATPSGKRIIDEIKLKIPLVKYFTRMGAVVQFSQTLGMLLAAGVNFSQALDIVVNITDNRVLADALSEARDKIIKQGKIAQYLKQTGIFPPIAIYLINTGEQTGQLDFMLNTVAQNYEVELGELADSLSSKLSIILLLVMAAIVGFIIMAIAIPIMNMSGAGGATEFE
jgi:type II secretory pathway component PulF